MANPSFDDLFWELENSLKAKTGVEIPIASIELHPTVFIQYAFDIAERFKYGGSKQSIKNSTWFVFNGIKFTKGK